MGEAKRRKKSGLGFGKTPKNTLEVKLVPDLVLPEEMDKLKQSLSADRKQFFTGTVIISDREYPAIFIPYTGTYQGQLKLYSHIAFDPDNHPAISKHLTNRISQEVCRQITSQKLFTPPRLTIINY